MHGDTGNGGQIPGRGVMIIIGQTVGIDKIGIPAAQRLCSLGHVVGKVFHAAPYPFCNGGGRIVTGQQHGCIHQVNQPYLFPGSQLGRGFILRHVHGIFAHRHDLVRIAAVEGQPHGHDLGGGSRMHPDVRILAENHLAGFCFDQNGGRCIQMSFGQKFRIIGVIFTGIGTDRKADEKQHCQQQCHHSQSFRLRHAGLPTFVRISKYILHYIITNDKCTVLLP